MMNIPMPGHPISGESNVKACSESVKQLRDLIDTHDVVSAHRYSRESMASNSHLKRERETHIFCCTRIRYLCCDASWSCQTGSQDSSWLLLLQRCRESHQLHKESYARSAMHGDAAWFSTFLRLFNNSSCDTNIKHTTTTTTGRNRFGKGCRTMVNTLHAH